MRLVFAFGSTSATSIPAEWAEGLQCRGHDIAVVPVSGYRTPAQFLRALMHEVRLRHTDVLHVHHTLPALAPLGLRLAGQRVRTVLTVHRLATDMDFVARSAHYAAMIGADAVVANSQATLDSLPTVAQRFSRCELIYNGVDFDRLDSARLPTESSPYVRIVSVGRLVPEKGFDTLLQAMAILNGSSSCHARLTVVGGGPEAARLGRLAAELHIEHLVTFTGALSRHDTYQLLWSSDVFALCSKTEGFCNAAVEAMAAGLPLVVTPVGALPEVVGTCARIADGVEADAIAAELKELLENSPADRRALGDRASERARELFSLGRTLDRYEALYADLSMQESGVR